jgi:hypothetical protein
MIIARARGRALEEMTMIFTIGKRCPRRRLPKAPTAEATAMTTATTTMMATVVTTTEALG